MISHACMMYTLVFFKELLLSEMAIRVKLEMTTQIDLSKKNGGSVSSRQELKLIFASSVYVSWGFSISHN